MSIDDVRAAAARWPDITAPPSAFVVGLREDDAGEQLADRFLAWAALQGDPDAVHQLCQQVRTLCPRGIRAAGASAYDAGDLEQDVMTSLLIGSATRPPTLTQYDGRGPLGGWLRACVVRRCLMWRRRRSPLREASEVSDRLLGDDIDAELRSLRAEDKRLFADALAKAFADLDGADRTLLRYYYVDGLDLRQIGRILDVHPATISRRLQKGRAEILKRMQSELSEQGAADHVWRNVRSQLEVSLGTLLRTM
ncbi:MAG: sigma-70 family RNA polymerase sigma factor [Nannocystales bacterium]